MKKIALLLGIVSLFGALGCEQHPPQTDHHGHGDKDAAKKQEAAPTPTPAEGAHATPPQFFPKQS